MHSVDITVTEYCDEEKKFTKSIVNVLCYWGSLVLLKFLFGWNVFCKIIRCEWKIMCPNGNSNGEYISVSKKQQKKKTNEHNRRSNQSKPISNAHRHLTNSSFFFPLQTNLFCVVHVFRLFLCVYTRSAYSM